MTHTRNRPYHDKPYRAYHAKSDRVMAQRHIACHGILEHSLPHIITPCTTPCYTMAHQTRA
eukprot:9045263-Pyramimonas_sp.AAC.1